MTGADLTPETLWIGYSMGCFPMTDDEATDEVNWYRPDPRCLFPIDGVHVSRSLAKTLRRGDFRVTFDTAFEEVMWSCRRPEGNWISPEFVRVYGQAYRQGWAHSVEVWADEDLVGGLYGLALGACFCAESMFHRRTDASKVALNAIVNRCRELDFEIFDAQIMNPHLASMGAFEVSHEDYMHAFSKAVTRTTDWCPRVPPWMGDSLPGR